MPVAILVYSVATGRRRRGYYDTQPVANVIAFLNECPIGPGEARMVYNATGTEGPQLHALQQAAINQVTGLNVQMGVDANDTYAVIDAGNNIVHVGFFDPACGDAAAYPGMTMVKAPAGCAVNWTYDGQTFSPPVFQTKSAVA